MNKLFYAVSNLWTVPMPNYSLRYFKYFRIALGLFSIYYFLSLVPYASELFGSQGVIAYVFRRSLYSMSTELWIFLLVFASVCSLLFAIGYERSRMSIILWACVACVLNENPLLSSFTLSNLGILFIAMALTPDEAVKVWYMPKFLHQAIGYFLAISYSSSGITKLSSSYWRSGGAIEKMLTSPRARDLFLNDWILLLPSQVFTVLTYIFLFSEIVFLPGYFFKRTRKYVWLAILLMNLGIGSLTQLTKLSTSLIFLHFFVFQPEWITDLLKKIGRMANTAKCN